MFIIVFMILNYAYSNNYRGRIATCSNKKKKMPEIISLSYKITRLDRGIQENVDAMKLFFSCLISVRSLINRCNV